MKRSYITIVIIYNNSYLKMKVILLVGRQRVGKDTVADILCEHIKNHNRISLAYCLKKIIANTFKISIEELDRLKNNKNTIFGIEVRNILINFSESMIDIFGENVWCDIVNEQLDINKINIITDIRFLREYKYFQKYKPVTIKIIRNDIDITNEESEVDKIPCDHLLNNNSSIDVLKHDLLSKKLFSIKFNK